MIHPIRTVIGRYRSRRPLTLARLASSLAVLSILFMAGGFSLGLFYALATGDYRRFLSHQLLVPVSTIIYAMIGKLIISRRPENPIGWIFATVGLLYGLNALSVGYGVYANAISNSGTLAGILLANWLNTWIWIPEILLPTTFVFLLFPYGRLLSPRWGLVAWPAALGLVAVVAGIAFRPGLLEAWGAAGSNPFGITAGGNLLEILVRLGYVLISIGLIGSLASLIIRFRRSRGIERQQMKWLVYAAALMVFALVVGAVVGTIWPDNPGVSEFSIALTSLVILGIALATSIAILRHRLYDIDLIINRTIVYGTLSAGVLGIYAFVVGALGTLFQARGSWITALVATGLVAVLFQPLRERLQRWVNRLIYGERDEPFEVLARLGQQLEGILAPQTVYDTIVETVSQALKLPYVAINLSHDDGVTVAAQYGKPCDQPVVFPLIYQGDTVGNLHVAQRAPNEAFNEVEERLLRNIARQAGAAVHAVQLTEDLQRSRQRLVTAREEERRRLRRDLHDGLGPQLATLTLKIDAARNLLDQNPAAAGELLNQLKEETKSALGDIRRIAYNLRPPALDELGLIPALREHVTSLNQQEGLQISVQAPENSPPLPAAVEVAAYRIAMEGLTNVIHHAQAHKCVLRINVDRHLEVEICDDGRGLPANIRSGVGLSSMRERVAELGGAFMINQGPEGGMRLRAKLPLNSVSSQSNGKG
jgi:two-component system NarL family sensor kinase